MYAVLWAWLQVAREVYLYDKYRQVSIRSAAPAPTPVAMLASPSPTLSPTDPVPRAY